MSRRRASFRLAVLVCLGVLSVAIRVACAQGPRPVTDVPATPQFLSRYDFHLAAAYLGEEDHDQFMWDTHWGGNFDLIDYVVGRFGFLVDYQAILGHEYRAFDPNQSNYTLEFSSSGRFGRNEIAGVFHHVSWHLSDRPKRISIAVNMAGVRLLRRFELGGTSVDLVADGGYATARAYVDYTWTGHVDMMARRPLQGRFGVFGHAAGTLTGTEAAVADRTGSQKGGRVEGGVRVAGRGGALELFAGWERVIDADPVLRQPRSWPFAGFRFVN
jgi:hypothetical protein